MGGKPSHAADDLMRFPNLHLRKQDPFTDFRSLDVAGPLDIPAKPLSRSVRAVLEAFYRLSDEAYRLGRSTND